jgi:hypothetical protein
MKRSTLIFGLVFLFCLSTVTALNVSDPYVWWSFDDNLSVTKQTASYGDLSFGTYASHISDCGNSTSGCIYAINGTLAGGENVLDDIATSDTGSISMKVLYNDTMPSCQSPIYHSDGFLIRGNVYNALFYCDDKIVSYYWDGSARQIDSAASYPEQEWVCVQYSWKNGESKLWVNGNLESTSSFTWYNTQSVSVNEYYGGYSATIGASDKFIDEVAYYNDYFTNTNIEEINNNSCRPIAYFEKTSFELNLKNKYNSSYISSFTAEINNGTISQNITTTNGSVFWGLDEVINITIFNITGSEGAYFNLSYENYDSNFDLDAEAYQSILYVYAIQNFTNNTITNFNTTVGTQFNNSVSGYTTHYLNANTFNYTAKAENQNYNSTGNVTLTSLEIKNVTIGFIPFCANVTAKEFFTNATINNFTLQVISEYYTQNFTTTVGWIEFCGVNGTYNLTIKTDDYADESILFNMYDDNMNYTFYLYTTNSIYFRFYDEVTLDLIDSTTLDIELISNIFAKNYSTSNGTLYIDILSPSVYIIRSKADGYDTRFYRYKLENNSNIEIKIYLVNSSLSNYKEIPLNIIDENTDPVSAAVAKLLRYDLVSNSYTIREIIETDSQGKAYFDVVQFEEFYKFIVEYEGETKKIDNNGFQIADDEYTRQIIISGTFLESFYDVISIYGVVNYIDSSNNFKFEFNDPSNQITKGCIEIWQIKTTGDELIDTSCVLGTSGSIYYPITPVNYTSYKANAFIYYGSTKEFIDQDVVFFKPNFDFDLLTVLGVIILCIVIFGLTIEKNKVVCLIATPTPLTITSFFGWFPLGFELALGIHILFIIIAIIVSRYN